MFLRSFFGQVPFILISGIVALHGLPASPKNKKTSKQSRIRDIDFAGIITFATSIIALLFLLQAVGMKDDSQDVGVRTLALAFVLSSGAFFATEAFWVKKPLIPVHLLTQNLGAYCLIQVLFFSGRLAVCHLPSPSFTITTGSTVNEANEVSSLSVILLHISSVSWVRVTLWRLRRIP